MATAEVNRNVRYEPEESPPGAITVGLGVQAGVITLPAIVIGVVIVVKAGGGSDGYLAWAAFAVLLVSGFTTLVQAVRFGRIGSGHILIMGTSGAFFAVCIAALLEAGPATMASLVVVSSLFQFLLAAKLSLLRRIFTPVVAGSVIMLITATVMPAIFPLLDAVPEETPSYAAPLVAVVSLAVLAVVILKGTPAIRLWAPIAAIIVGCILCLPFGIYDAQPIIDAPWIGIPGASWPGLDLTPGVEFWALLPAFVAVTIVGAIETVGDGVAIQRVSRRRPQATDFRVVQGCLNADGLGNLLSGIAGTLPNTTYSSSISITEVTGVAARRVGVVIGVTLMVLAFFPKVAALLIAIPGPVIAAHATVFLGILFVQGMRIVIGDGMDHRKATICGLTFWVGVGFQNGWIFQDQLGDGFLAVLLGNGMTAGAITAVLLTLFLNLAGSRQRQLRVPLVSESLGEIDRFLRQFAQRAGWTEQSTERLASAGEETLAVLLQEHRDAESPLRLSVAVRPEDGAAEMDFVTTLEGENVEDHLAYLSALAPVPDEREVSYRLLLHYASSVTHQKYHGVDIITVRVDSVR